MRETVQFTWKHYLCWILCALFGATLSAQGDLSSQVLRLLTRTNTWSSSAVQTFQNNIVMAAVAVPSDTTNKIYNLSLIHI